MNIRILSSSAIVCSAFLAYGWLKPLADGSGTDCDYEPQQARSSKKSDRETRSEAQCLRKASIPMPNFVPEQLLNVQWGNWLGNQLPNKLEDEYETQLKEAQVLAGRGSFKQAITETTGIPKNSRHFKMVQQLQEDWSQELLRQATVECQQARVGKAISILAAIPSTSQFHHQASELQNVWGQQGKILKQAIAAKEARDWQKVINTIQLLEGTSMYHSLFVQNLLQKAIVNLYEPDRALLEIATIDLPTIQN